MPRASCRLNVKITLGEKAACQFDIMDTVILAVWLYPKVIYIINIFKCTEYYVLSYLLINNHVCNSKNGVTLYDWLQLSFRFQKLL